MHSGHGSLSQWGLVSCPPPPPVGEEHFRARSPGRGPALRAQEDTVPGSSSGKAGVRVPGLDAGGPGGVQPPAPPVGGVVQGHTGGGGEAQTRQLALSFRSVSRPHLNIRAFFIINLGHAHYKHLGGTKAYKIGK